MEHLQFNEIKVYNFEGAFRGMRNPKNSWHLSDSAFGVVDEKYISAIVDEVTSSYMDKDDYGWDIKSEYLQNNGLEPAGKYLWEYNLIGAKDMKLAQRLIRGGSEHRKFMRQIFVSVDITAPLYWWKEFDTYKVGTVANSTSTMHKLAETPITRDCFLFDNSSNDLPLDVKINVTDDNQKDLMVGFISRTNEIIDFIICACENLRQKYLETKDIRYWRALIQLLPNAWVQTRTVTMNYENLLAICSKSQRRNHKLREWREDFIGFARGLPYAQDLIFIDELDETEE